MRLLMRRRPFLDRPGRCSVCSTELLVDSAEELAASGWIVQRDAALCPSCESVGWELSSALVPHRRGSGDPTPEATVQPAEVGRRRLRLPRTRPSVNRLGWCSVCDAELLVGRGEELSSSGWTAERDAAICPSCKTEGWKLSPESFPYREAAGGTWQPPPVPRQTVPRGSPRMAAARLVALLAAGAAGLLAGASGSGSDVKATSASSDALQISTPSDWERRPVGARLPGLSPSLELAPRDGADAGLVAGDVSSVERLIDAQPSGRPVDPELVVLGDVLALEYRGLKPGRPDTRLTLYVVPSDRRDVGVACLAGGTAAARLLERCEGVASSVVLADGEGIPAGAVGESAASLTRTMRELRAIRARGRASLSTARTASGQARASRHLARSYSTAASKLLAPPAAPASGHLYPDVIAALRKAEAAYTALGSAARHNQPAGFYTARRDIRRAEAALQGALRQTRRMFAAGG